MKKAILIPLTALVLSASAAAQQAGRKARLDSLAGEVAASGILAEDYSKRIENTTYKLLRRPERKGTRMDGFYDGNKVAVHLPRTASFEQWVASSFQAETTIAHEEAHRHYSTLDGELKEGFRTEVKSLMDRYLQGETLTEREQLVAQTLQAREEYYREWYKDAFEDQFYGTEAYATMAELEYRNDAAGKPLDDMSILHNNDKRHYQQAINTFNVIPQQFQRCYEGFFASAPEQ
ncbi:MAG: hypothetical protein JW724_06285 [Candidatus Altiarchaeota archaeon]|nr:hypothetical protein [Candidatus Altiarchaeota archaeon]